MRLTLGLIAEWAKGRLTRNDPNRAVTGVSTDSRNVQPGELFVALKGPTFDGNAFAAEALKRGAAAALVQREDVLDGGIGIIVPDTLAALGDLAHRYRWHPPLLPWIAVTGSNGKTTTREMIARLLSLRGPVAVPMKNFNNQVGLPLSILARPEDAWIGVLEMGTSAPGEIDRLCRIATPTVGLVTGVAPAHLAGLGSPEGVAAEKASVFERLPHDGVAIYPAHDMFAGILASRVRGPRATFAVEKPADMVAENVRTGKSGVDFRVRGIEFHLPLFGVHNVSNCLAALLAVEHFGVKLPEAAEALRKFPPVHDRLELIETEHLAILSDVYNANPGSLAAGVAAMETIPAPRRVVVVGDMLELGPHSAEIHRETGRLLTRRKVDAILAVGSECVALAEGAAGTRATGLVRHFRTVPALIRAFDEYLKRGDLVLVKGSRGMKMETVVEALRGWEPSAG